MNSYYPRVLIIGQPFNSTSGGGITLRNLFIGWPKDHIAVAANINSFSMYSDETYDNFYSLGKKEYLATWPLNLFQKQLPSGPSKSIRQNFTSNAAQPNSSNVSSRVSFVKCFFDILHFFGLFHKLYKFSITQEFLEWVKEFNPDIIYTQLSSRSMISFVGSLNATINKRLAIHMMDDWPKTISKPGLFQKYWEKKIDLELRNLIDKADILFSISDGMSKEYFKRYHKVFIPFHNPVDLAIWLPYTKQNYNVNKPFSIKYTGRIGTAASSGIVIVCKAVHALNEHVKWIELDIYTPDYKNKVIKSVEHLNGINIYQNIPYQKMPELLSQADLLLLALDFDRNSIRFAKLSMPTKTSEFMISGVPILLFCSPQLSLYQHAIENEWAYVVSVCDTNSIKHGILELYEDHDLRKRLGVTAHQFALQNYSSEKIREQFKNTLMKLQNK
jgi:glycosyltransferase involved in cell wall biosynthesis